MRLAIVLRKMRASEWLYGFVSFVMVTAFVPPPALQAAPPDVQADSQVAGQSGTAEPQRLVPQFSPEPVPPTAAQQAASEAALRQGHGHGPAGVGQRSVRGPQTPATEPIEPKSVLPNAPGTFTIFRNKALAPGTGGLSQSPVNEPSLANSGRYVWYTGNWYAARSIDAGNTWSYVSPYADMADFCCDQDVVFDKGHDLLIWYRQATGAPNRYVLSSSIDGGASWCSYSINNANYGNPFGATDWFDYPHLALSNDYVYITSNMFNGAGAFQRMIITKIPLDPLRDCAGFGFNWWARATGWTWTPVQGATDVMYFGDHTDTNTLNICWIPEATNLLSCVDRDIDAWTFTNRGNATCPVPDGHDPCLRLDQRINAGWLKEDESQNRHLLGFFWTVQEGAGFPFPYVNAAVFDPQTLTYLARPSIWNPSFAFLYAGAAPNARGHLGIATYLAGGGNYVQLYVGIDDDFNGAPPGWEIAFVRASNDGPDANNWGDYLRVRPHSPDGVTWIAGGHTLQGGGTGTFVEPRFIVFGRGRDNDGLKRFWTK